MHRILILLLVATGCSALKVTPEMSPREAYVARYAAMARAEMKRSGVPASITLAQGMLESGNGTSRLAVKGRNHFGIKCHKGWEGRKIYEDDDREHECFRRYRSVRESYRDHSDFLRTRTRYSALFELEPDDYRGWAQGLQKAGYATNPKYAERLTALIEAENLQRFDRGAKRFARARASR
jgi:flagellum-specific peptidoglycan hydrolase FlgJ